MVNISFGYFWYMSKLRSIKSSNLINTPPPSPAVRLPLLLEKIASPKSERLRDRRINRPYRMKG